MEGKKINTQARSLGRGKEGNAIKALHHEQKRTHKNVTIGRSGFRLHQKFHFIGASADGKGSCDCDGDFFIEIRCVLTSIGRNSLFKIA